MKEPVVVSPVRVGSTIIQNVAYIILHGKYGVVKKCHYDESNINSKVIVPIRDPRNMVLSIKRTLIDDVKTIDKVNDLSFLDNHIISNNLNLMNKLYVKYKDNPNAIIIRYEDVHVGELGKYNGLIKKLCDFMGVPFTEDLSKRVHELLDINKIKTVTDKIGKFAVHDNSTDFSMAGSHVESIKIKDWSDRVPEELSAQFNDRLKDYIKNLDYEL